MKKAFTLIELLVVISIIALLSSIVLSSLNTARSKARDAKRFSDMDALVKAFSLYASDNGGSYPAVPGTGSVCIGLPSAQTCWGDRLVPGSDTLITQLTPYLKVQPADPLPERGWGDRYAYEDGTISVGCGVSNDSGHFILFRPDAAGNTNFNASLCPLTSVKGCCPSGSTICGNNGGYFCARKIDN